MTLIVAGIIALLYILGVQLGKGFKDSINIIMEEEGLQLDRTGEIMLTWLWPIAAARAMLDTSKGEE